MNNYLLCNNDAFSWGYICCRFYNDGPCNVSTIETIQTYLFLYLSNIITDQPCLVWNSDQIWRWQKICIRSNFKHFSFLRSVCKAAKIFCIIVQFQILSYKFSSNQLIPWSLCWHNYMYTLPWWFILFANIAEPPWKIIYLFA